MSGISGISSYSSYNPYSQIASGNKLPSAANGAAELTIAEKQDAQIRGYNAGTNNLQSGKDVLNITDAALGGVTDYLQRIRELALQASNTATVTDSDRRNIQHEVDQLKQGKNIALITDAGTPGISDPGEELVRIALEGLPGNVSRLWARFFLKEEKRLSVEVKDLGFGGFRASSGRVWKEEIELD